MKKPLYVKIGLFAVPTRKAAKSYLYICLLAASSFFVWGLVYEAHYFAVFCSLIATFWYKVSIRWMDDNNGWGSEIKEST